MIKVIIPSAGIENKIKSLQEQIDYVGIDNQKASEQGIQHLIDNKFKSPSFVSIDVQQTQMLGRLEGYRNIASNENFEAKELLLPYDLKSNEQGRAILKEFFDQNQDIDSILFATNYLTQLGLEVLKNHFPEKLHNLGIITFDDNALFSICTPSITAICQPLDQMAEKTMELLFELIKNKKSTSKYSHQKLDTTLEIRESTLSLSERS